MLPLAITTTILIVAMTGSVYGQTPESLDHLKKSNPVQLGIGFVVVGCPDTEKAYERIVEGELVRAGVKRGPLPRLSVNTPARELALAVIIQCIGSGDGGRGLPTLTAVSIDIYFLREYVTIDTSTGETASTIVTYIPGTYGNTYLMGGAVLRRELKEKLREHIADALTDYLKANHAP